MLKSLPYFRAITKMAKEGISVFKSGITFY